MSLILEALKKAERQHKLGEVPRIRSDSEQPASTASHRLGWLMLSLLAMILIGVGIYLGSSSWLTPASPESSISHSEPKPQDTIEMGSPESVAPVNNEEVISLPNTVQSSMPSQAVEEPVAVVSPPQEKQVEFPTVVVSEPPPPPPPPRPPKPLHEMASGFVANLPPMSIDIHSYDKRPVKRYVLINMEKYREGDYVAEGPRLIEILPQGAVMEHMGEQFILPIGNQ
jgi:general secretion pathway protein B